MCQNSLPSVRHLELKFQGEGRPLPPEILAPSDVSFSDTRDSGLSSPKFSRYIRLNYQYSIWKLEYGQRDRRPRKWQG